MIRNLLASTAIATLVATGAYAQTEPMPMQQEVPMVVHAEGHLASNIIGERVYNSAGDEGENIGSVNDLLLNPEGNVDAVVIGVGGFLGIGQKDVAVDYNLVQWVEREGNRYLVVETTREALEAQPDFDKAAFRPLPADYQVGHTQPATAEDLGAPAPAADAQLSAEETAPADDGVAGVEVTPPEEDFAADESTPPVEDEFAAEETAPAEDGLAADETTAPAEDSLAEAPAETTAPAEDGLAEAPAADTPDEMETSAIDRSTLSDVDAASISADDLIGTTVYGSNDENVGAIGDVILSQDGNVEAVIVDVGGFLGIGSKQVAVSMDNLAFLSDEGGNYHLYTPFTQEQLEAQPEYDPASYAEFRDDQLLIIR